ncbi:MAG: alternative ribosome rescue aminoacyl-tRNA hydrolase ArfB [Polyangiales bacterium]
MDPLRVSDDVVIPAAHLAWAAARSGGPGGQNVNKVASKVELRYDLDADPTLSPAVKARLRALAAGRLDAEGRVLITSQKTRDQPRNLVDALERLRALIVKALTPPPPPRKATKPSRGARERRLTAKHQRSDVKKGRRGGHSSDD